MSIIRQEQPFFAVPDFRNLGVALRIFASTIVLIMILPLVSAAHHELPYWVRLVNLAVWMAPAVLLTVVLLWFLNRVLHRLPLAPLWVVALVVTVFCGTEYFFNRDQASLRQHFWVVGIYTLVLMHYQSLLQKAYSPALVQAQLSALTARIRPHFLFNSLNAAIGLVRRRPDDAEMVLENLADLFRAQLQEADRESTLGREIELARGYIDIERIRMGESRLHVQWHLNAPDNARVPHLLLQPLLENAVYHGVEPSYRLGMITVGIVRKGSWIYIRIDNPLPPQTAEKHASGNKMALKNLSERLFLMYDRDATLSARTVDDFYRVDIRLPYYPYGLRAHKATVKKS
ncbi:MAG: histidine kinase [Neisseria sp.]|nr:histidine kinase [Neisseria sp.]